MGRPISATLPTITMTIDRTVAKIGRSMKKWEIMGELEISQRKVAESAKRRKGETGMSTYRGLRSTDASATHTGVEGTLCGIPLRSFAHFAPLRYLTRNATHFAERANGLPLSSTGSTG